MCALSHFSSLLSSQFHQVWHKSQGWAGFSRQRDQWGGQDGGHHSTWTLRGERVEWFKLIFTRDPTILLFNNYQQHKSGKSHLYDVISVNFLCLRPVGCRRHYVFELSVCMGNSWTQNLKNPWVDFYHTWPRGAPWWVDELIRFWVRFAQGQRLKVNEFGLNMLFLPR